MPRGLGDDPLSRQRKGASAGVKAPGSESEGPSFAVLTPNDVFFRRKPEEQQAALTQAASSKQPQPPAPAQQPPAEPVPAQQVSVEMPVVDDVPAQPESKSDEPKPIEEELAQERKRGFFSRIFGRR